MKSKTNLIINIIFCLSVCFLIAAILTRWLEDIETAPKAPPCPAADSTEQQIITPQDGS